METKHTPGPWAAIRSIPEEGCDGWWIKAQPHAAMRGFTHDFAWVNGGNENEANARLIAAAPDLLAALKRVMQLSVSAGSDEIFSEVRAALAKAEGRS